MQQINPCWENGGYLSINTQWGRNVLNRMERDGMKMTRILGTTCKLPVAPGLLKEVKLGFQRKIKQLQVWHNIPDELIVNFDQTPLSYVSSSKHTLHFKGQKSVPLIGKGRQKQITGTFACTMAGDYMPMQLIYEGLTDRCHPKDVEFPEGFNITHSHNHWSNGQRVAEHLEMLIFPYLRAKREELGLPAEQRALLIYDVFKGQLTPAILKLIDDNYCVMVPVPANLTHHFQPLDLLFNSMAKKFLNKKFEEWYAKQISDQLKQGVDVYQIKVDLTLTRMKPIHARWVIGLYDYLRNQSDCIKESFDKAGIVEAVYGEIEGADPFADLD